MATVQSVLTDYVRTDLADEIQSRFTDSQLLQFFKRAVRRANSIGQQNKLPFLQVQKDIDLVAGADSFNLPADFFTPISLTRTSDHIPLQQKSGRDWDLISSSSELAVWTIDGPLAYVKAPPASDTTLSLRYYSQVFPVDITLSDQTPWGGKLDEILCDYVVFRAKHLDEFDTSVDVAMLNEMEADIMAAFSGVNPITIKSRGWLWHY